MFSRAENNEDDTIEVRFRSKQTNGLLAWVAEGGPAAVGVNGGYMALALAEGHLEFNLNLGGMRKAVVLRSTANLNDGRWHHAKITVNAQMASLQVDSSLTTTVAMDHSLEELSSSGVIWVGFEIRHFGAARLITTI